MNKPKGINEYLFNVLLVLASISLLAMMLIVAGNVIGRLFFNAPITGSFEIAGLSGILMGAVALGFTEKERRNVTVEALTILLPKRIQCFLESFMGILSLTAVGLLFWAVLHESLYAFQSKETTTVVGIATYPFKFVWAFGTLLLCIFVLRNIIIAFKKGCKK